MTISNTDRSVKATGDGANKTWPYSFRIPSAAAVNVILIEIATGVETSIDAADYTITGLDDPNGGEVTYPTIASGNPAITSAFELLIYREVPRTQSVVVSNQTRYDANIAERVWDRLTMMIQDITGDFDLALRFPVGDTADNVLPNAVVRADTALVFGPSGEVTVSASTAANLAATQALYDAFDARYLGEKTVDPTLDNQGNALLDGALYYNTTTNRMMVYDLGTTTWIIGWQGGDVDVNSISFDGTTFGTMSWNATDATLDVTLNDDVTLQVGQEMHIYARNETGGTLANGTLVYINGATGNKPTIAVASNDAEITSSTTMGFTTEEITNNSLGYVVTSGFIRGIDTSGFTEGASLWLGTAGTAVEAKPATPAHLVFVGTATRIHATDGVIFVKVANGPEVDELHDVLISAIQDGQTLIWDDALGYWKNADSGGGPSVGTNAIIRTNANNIAENITLADHSTTFTATNATNVANVGTDNGFADGDTVYLTTTAADLPNGWLEGTQYYVINATASTLQLSLTYGGAAVTISDDGTGTHTIYQNINGHTAGPVTIESGFTVTVAEGSVWSIS
jgi:hypothetical protein